MKERAKVERYFVGGALNTKSCKNNAKTKGIRMHQFPCDCQ